jgi:DNA modification methylase
MAADATGRRARAIELDPYYVDVAVRRWQDKTGRSAIHAGTGATFAERERDVVK